jgi:hypothetical protein
MGGDGAEGAVADAVVDEIRQEGGTAVASYDSVDSPEGGGAIVGTALAAFGRLDAVVSNAGIFQTAPFDELTAAEWRRMLRVHLDGAFHLAQPAYRAMKAQGYGRFVFIASSAGLFGQPHSAHYAAAKAGTVGLASRACDLTHHNFSACAGRFARAFVGLGDGWVADTDGPTAEDIAGHLEPVAAADPYTIPGSIFDEVAQVCDRLGIGT